MQIYNINGKPQEHMNFKLKIYYMSKAVNI